MADINVIVLPDGTEYPVSDYYLPVAISNPTNGQVLKYDAENQVWYNGEDTSGSSILYGTSAPTSQLGTDGCLYVKYTEGTGGASDTVDALYVKLDGSWCQISTGGGGGTSDYSDLTNKPQINSIELSGNKSLDDLGVQPSEISKTATGSIVTFSDGGDNIPVESFECEIVAQQESGTPTPDNPLLITGFDSADILVSGINIWDEQWEVGTIDTSTGANIPNASRYRSVGYIKITPNEIYRIIMPTSNDQYMIVYIYDQDKNFIGIRYKSNNTTINENAHYIRFSVVDGGVVYNNDISINYPSTETTYHAYKGTTYIIQFDQTVYGGKLIYDNGQWSIEATHSIITYNSSTGFSEHTSDRFYKAELPTGLDLNKSTESISNVATYLDRWNVYGGYFSFGSAGIYVNKVSASETLTDFNTRLSNTPFEVLYPLATPVIIPITSSTRVKTISGVNNIFSNTGDSTLKYFTNDADGIEELIDVSETSAENTTIDDTNLAYEADNVQEAFEKITKSLTWAEYQALSDAEKNNGTVYFITDVDRYEYGSGYVAKSLLSAPIVSPSTGNISLLEDYTKFDELEIIFGVNAANDDQVYCDKLDVQELISGKKIFVGGMITKLYGVYIQFGYYDNTTIAITRFEKNGWGEASKIYDIKGVKYETEGVHYSTDEQVIGTWIDGKPLYEKTIKFNNKTVTMNENTSELVHGISDIDTAFVHEAYADFGGGENWSTAMNGILAGSTMCYFQWKIGSTAIYLVANNLSFSASTDRSYLFVIRYTKSS